MDKRKDKLHAKGKAKTTVKEAAVDASVLKPAMQKTEEKKPDPTEKSPAAGSKASTKKTSPKVPSVYKSVTVFLQKFTKKAMFLPVLRPPVAAVAPKVDPVDATALVAKDVE